jgi:hypothetical protein
LGNFFPWIAGISNPKQACDPILLKFQAFFPWHGGCIEEGAQQAPGGGSQFA